MKKVKIISLLLSFLICFAAAFIGSAFTIGAIPTWYASLNKPFFNPPNWIFGPVWSALYLMMGISLYSVWTKSTKKPEKQKGLIYFFIQLAVNAGWSIVFFGLHNPPLALLVLIILWITIFQTTQYFFKISRPAGCLLIPYLAWVSFAILLNVEIVLLNR